MVGPMRPQIVLFGSSIVQFSFDSGGWGAILANLYSRKADIILRGYSGWNSRQALDVLDEVFPKDAPVQPSLVIVYFGGNDSVHPHPSGLGPHVPLQEYVENMRRIANHLKSLSDHIRVIFLSSPPINEEQIRKKLRSHIINHKLLVLDKFSNEYLADECSATQSGRTNESCGEYAEALMELCEEMNIKAINLWSAIQTRDDWLDVSFTDGVHLTAEGSKVVVKEILRVLREADWKTSLHWMSMATEFAEDSPYYPPSPDGTTTINVSYCISRKCLQWDL
ncbi:GDSL esterase/lipase CPRD49, partial [Mucuna pruriens]